jgi:hypothetical protein
MTIMTSTGRECRALVRQAYRPASASAEPAASPVEPKAPKALRHRVPHRVCCQAWFAVPEKVDELAPSPPRPYPPSPPPRRRDCLRARLTAQQRVPPRQSRAPPRPRGLMAAPARPRHSRYARHSVAHSERHPARPPPAATAQSRGCPRRLGDPRAAQHTGAGLRLGNQRGIKDGGGASRAWRLHACPCLARYACSRSERLRALASSHADWSRCPGMVWYGMVPLLPPVSVFCH